MGHMCATGTFNPIPCQSGTYNNNLSQTACTNCLSGYYCPNNSMTQGLVCPQGHYCPTRSLVGVPCPIGTIGVLSGLKTESECVLCPSGYYCGSTGLITPTGLCSKGYYCRRGCTTPTPTHVLCHGNDPRMCLQLSCRILLSRRICGTSAMFVCVCVCVCVCVSMCL
eukprot:GHVR01154533.1.p1 GENE.GHVR01154533.1~~GHVR01154533.1.p1  ORF type:complete len:167 (+),score=32.26 GHVR01154533.1:153-653(+)